jgi:hypothetical protein
MLLSLLLAAAASGASCPVAMDALLEQADAGIASFEDMDADGFQRAVHVLREQIACPEAAVDAELARRLHLVMALDAFTDQEPARAREAFRAVLAADPTWRPPASLAPLGNPLRVLFEEARRDDPALGADLAEPTVGSFYVDGVEATERPSDRPFVLQWLDEHGNVRWSDWLPAGAHLPIEVLAAMHEEDPMDFFEQAPPPPKPVEPLAPAPVEDNGRGASVALLAGAGGSALASGGLLVAALVTRGQWSSAVDECVTWGGCEDAPGAAQQEHDDLAKRARTLGYAAQGTAGLALGLGIAGGVTLVW